MAYLGPRDEELVLKRGCRHPVPLADCGLQPFQRFSSAALFCIQKLLFVASTKLPVASIFTCQLDWLPVALP